MCVRLSPVKNNELVIHVKSVFLVQLITFFHICTVNLLLCIVLQQQRNVYANSIDVFFPVKIVYVRVQKV